MFDKFLPYIGNNHNNFPPSESYRLGSMRFSQLIGRELNEDFWNILTEIFNVSKLRIYKPNEAQWCDGTQEGTMYVYLDDNDKVKDIYYHPYHNFIIGQDVDKDGNYYKKGIVSLVCHFIKRFRLLNVDYDAFQWIKEALHEMECPIDDNLLRIIIDNEFCEINPKWKMKGTSTMGEGFICCPYLPEGE